MGIVRRQSTKAVIFSYLGTFLGALNVGFLYPRILSAEEFGLTRALLSVAIVVGLFAEFGFTNTLVRYYNQFENKAKGHNGLLKFIFVFPWFSLVLFSLLLLLSKGLFASWFQHKSPLLLQYFYWIIPYFFGLMYFNIVEIYFKATGRVAYPNFFRDFFTRLANTAIILLYYFSLITFQMLISLSIAVFFIAIFCLWFYLYWQGELSNLGQLKDMKKTWQPTMSNFLLFNLLGYASGILVYNLDTIMISSMLGLKDAGIYAIGILVATVLQIPQKPIAALALSFLPNWWQEKNYTAIQQFYTNASVQLTFLGCLGLALIIANQFNFHVISPNINTCGVWVIIILSISKLFDMFTSVNNEILNTSKEYRYNFIFLIALLVVIFVLNTLLIPAFGEDGIVGAAIAMLIASSLFNVSKLMLIYNKYKMHPFSKSALKSLMLLIFSTIFLHFIPSYNLFFDIIFRSTLVCIIFYIGILKLNISKEIKSSLELISYKNIIGFIKTFNILKRK